MKHLEFDKLPEFHRWVLAHANRRKLDLALSDDTSPYFDIALLINGVDVSIDFIKIIGEMEDQFDDLVVKKARMLLDDKSFFVETAVKDAFRVAMNEVFPGSDEGGVGKRRSRKRQSRTMQTRS